MNRPDQNDESKAAEEIVSMFKEDLANAKAQTDMTVQRTKAGISNLIHKVIGREPSADDEELEEEELVVVTEPTRVSTLVGKGLSQVYPKVTLDVQIAALFDEHLVREASSTLKNTYLNDKFTKIANQVTTDFQRKNESAENQIRKAKNNFENYIAGVIKLETPLDKENASSLLAEVLDSLKEKAYSDLNKESQDSQKLVQKTKRSLVDDFGVFFTNPAGRKTMEEIEAEDFVRQHFLQFKEKVQKDLLASKEITDKIANDTKEYIQESLEQKEHDVPEYSFNFSTKKAQNDLKSADQAMKEKVNLIKSGIDDKIKQQNVRAGSSKIEAVLANRAEKDFEEANKKAQEVLDDLKLKLSESAKKITFILSDRNE